MRKILITLGLLAALAVPTRGADWSGTIKDVEKSIMFIQVGEEGGCTGVVIDQAKHYVMTAGHCYEKELYADLAPARVVALDIHEDLMVLQVPDIDPSRPALKLAAKNPERGQEVMSAGFGYALESAQFRIAHVADDRFRADGITQDFFSLDATFVGGQSGGPVVNEKGEIVMIVQRGSNSVGIGIPADTIRKRIGRFFATK